MSEYRYYEFQTVDRPLSAADRQVLRGLSTRARITATSFTNSYQWGDFRGDPAKLMAQWFDLHLYLANWGSRRLMIRLPARMVDAERLQSILAKVEGAELSRSGENLILDIFGEEIETWDHGDDEDSDWLEALAPLRDDLLAGDFRLLYLLWLTGVSAEELAPDEPEPLPGIGPMTGPLEVFVEFFDLDRDLAAAAAERRADPIAAEPPSAAAIRQIIAGLADEAKTDLLARLVDGDALVAREVRALVRRSQASGAAAPPTVPRTAGDLRARAVEIRAARERAEAEEAAAEQKRLAKEAERLQRERIKEIVRRGEGVWREIEAEIERRNPPGYDKAASLLFDLRVIAGERGSEADFNRRLQAIRNRHARKERFLERLEGLE